ncbi:MAG: hypothetical protein WDN08_13625, partial [Rhizomicrobium sp.]
MTPAQVLAARAVPRPEPLRAPPPTDERRLFGLFGRKKKGRAAPGTGSARRAARHRPADAAPGHGSAASAGRRRRRPWPTICFPDQKRDEQFEIPAFLRRQSN